MGNNIFITYDLKQKQGETRDYKPVFAAIHALGTAVHLELSQFYVKTALSADDVQKKVWAAMRAGDKLVVVDASNNNAYMPGVSDAVLKKLQGLWNT
ncbi:hypothetical protein LH704_11735 [Burkholderia cenocepacia]|uniref:hypothetical protein n=1 Tax=Burkholderia cenocepacia TaxID=95486 RepID=UPI001F43D8AE|nr:hypothetical protein [Burkholderia cenocepacia]MCF1367327.1 hypothetical protein [Burkholderia cenocepacia]MCF1384860.1 hypothetical protein [Burkholderia cenocepacia]